MLVRRFSQYESESEVTYSQVWWPIFGICALQLTHPRCTHTQQWTHTHCEHTPGAVGSHLCCGAQGAIGGSCTSVVVLKVERALYIHSPHLQFLPARDSNSQPLDYESDSLTIRPRLPIQHILLILYCSSCPNLFGRLKCEMYLLYISPCLLTLTSQLSIGAIVSGLEFAHFCDVIS